MPSMQSQKNLPWLFGIQNGKCYYCGRKMRLIHGDKSGRRSPKDRATLEHIIPKSIGGESLGTENLAAACLECNQKKGNQLPPEIDKAVADGKGFDAPPWHITTEGRYWIGYD
jgi:5-methylcytosine-specific restriction endonuclease McrA